MNTLHVRKGDTIIVLSGKDKGKKGKVLEVSPTEQKVIVEGVNKVKKHVKPRKQGQAGGIIEAESALYACKVQVVCPECGKPTRIAHQFGENGEKTRNCKHCGKNL